jgi:glycosyltransferase involved in cell wall biosynthesis
VRRPRILRIITRLAVSGVSTHVTIADRGLAARGWETLLVHGRVQPDELEIDLPAPGVRTRRLPRLARPIDPADDSRALLELLRIMRAYRPDLVHTHHSKAGLLGRSAAILAGIPRIHTFHGHVFEGYFSPRVSAAIVATERRLAVHTSRIIAISELQREDLARRGVAPRDRITIVPLGLELDRFRDVDRGEARSRLGVPPDVFAAVLLGRIAPVKRVDRLLRVFARVHDRVPTARLYVVGDGAERAPLERESVALGLGDVVEFRGWSADAPGWYGASDVVVISSDNEGTPLTLIEAAAAGRPGVATAVGGVPDVVADGETGFVVPVEDEAAFADRLVRLALDPALTARLGAAAPARAARFGASRLVDDLERIYLDVLRERGRLP